ncbi:DUF4845 domain-containing protein [Ectothiorhodospiraceae bacterium 2226]|nr:DUF4845 domain-containing protein [Ectothiorhodospiraceae bacterium 2226]
MNSGQRGASLPGLLLIVVLLGLVVLSGIKLFPIYYQDFKVRSALNSLEREQEPQASPRAVMDGLMRRLQVNQVTDVNRNHINIRRQGAVYQVDVVYEIRQHWLGNLDVVAHFTHTAEVRAE